MVQLCLTQEYRSLSKIRKGNFLAEFTDAMSKKELISSFGFGPAETFEEALERYGPKKFLLFKLPMYGLVQSLVGYIADISQGKVQARIYNPSSQEFENNWFDLNLEDYGNTWYTLDDMKFKMEIYLLDHLNLPDYLEYHTGVDFKTTGETFLLVAEVPGEGWKEWEVMWLYDKQENDVHILVIPGMERLVLDADYYGDEWFLIPL